MRIPIHTEIISVLHNQLTQDHRFINLSSKQYQKLIRELITIWYFIYSEQQTKVNKEEAATMFFFVNIHKYELSQFRLQLNKIDYKHSKLIDILQDCNLVICNEKFSFISNKASSKYINKKKEDTHPKGYRINTTFLQNSNYTMFDIDFKKIFKNTRSKQYWLNQYPNHTHLINDVYASSIDLDKYLYWLQSNIGKELKTAKKTIVKDGKSIVLFEKQYLTSERIDQYFLKALKLNFKNVWFAVSKEGRFYNSVSNIPSSAVPFMKIDGNDTLEIDIANSQPLLLSVLLSEKQNRYKKDVEAGLFYQKVADYMGITRSKFKQMSYQFIFFNDKQLKSGQIYDALQAIYPDLITEINEIKSKDKLACTLQRMESAIFVDKIGNLPFKKLLRHDQAVITQENYEAVKQELIKEYKNIGLKVTF